MHLQALWNLCLKADPRLVISLANAAIFADGQQVGQYKYVVNFPFLGDI